MKIKRIIISNFKSLKDLWYTPTNKVAVLCGQNGTGKTSTMEGIRFGLTGDAPDNCINYDAGEASVEITFEKDELTVSRTKYIDKPTKCRVHGKVTAAKNLDQAILNNTGLARESLKVATSQDVLASLRPDALGAFLMSYVPEEADFDTIVKLAPSLSIEEQNVLKGYLPSGLFGLPAIEEAYKNIFEARAYVNKRKVSKAAQINLEIEAVPTRSLKEIEEEEKSISFQEGCYSVSAKAVEAYLAALKVRESAERSIKELEAQIASITATKPNEVEKKRILDAKAEYNDQILKANHLISIFETNTEMFQRTLESLNKPVCPISERLICTTDKTAIKEELQDMINANREGIALQQAIVASAKESLKLCESQESEWNENNRLYTQKTTLIKRLENEKKRLPSVPVKPESVEKVDFETAKKQLKAERLYCEAYERNIKIKEELEELEKEYAILNTLCKLLEPKGAIADALTSSYLAFFEDVINKRADELGCGYKVAFIIDNGVNYTIQTSPTSTFLPYENLSHGEQIISIFLLLDMLNSLCGTRLMLLDDVNHLDGENTELLISLVTSKAFQEDYDHIFIACTENGSIRKALAGVKDVDMIF